MKKHPEKINRMVRVLKKEGGWAQFFLLKNNVALSTNNAKVVFQIIIYIFELYNSIFETIPSRICFLYFTQTIKDDL
ncbi:hypothetical protein GILI108418_15355 [Gillisia limnaea]